VGGEAVFVGLLVIVELGGHVDDESHLLTDTLEAVHHTGRDLEQHRVLIAHEELVHLAVGGRAFASVVQHYLGHAVDANEVVGLDLVVMPALDRAGVNGSDVDLAELIVLLPIGAQHLHQIAPLVRDEPQLAHFDAFDH